MSPAPYYITRRKGYHDRRSNFIPPRKRFLIVCQGKKTEPNYFSHFRIAGLPIKLVQEPCSPLHVAQKAIRLAKQAENKADRYDEIWCVFDIDDTTRENVEGAVRLAEAKGIHIAYSNESFELWLYGVKTYP